MPVSADKSIIPVQFDFGIALSFDGHCGRSAVPLVFLDIHILQGHIGGLIFCRIHCDGIFGLFAVAGDGDVGRVLIVAQDIILVVPGVAVRLRIVQLGHISEAVLFGLYRHTALVQIVSVRKGRCGDGRDHCHQRSCRKYPQGQLLFYAFSHYKTLQTKKLAETRTLPGTIPKTGKNRNFGAENHMAVHFHARRLFVAQV